MAPPKDLTRFAVAVYGREGVSAACLSLQDGLAVDVNLVLTAAYLGAAHRHCLTQDQVVALRARSTAWRVEVVSPMRAVRRRLRSGPPPAPNERTEGLRSLLLEAELVAERIELAELADEASRWPATSPQPGAPAAVAAAGIRAVLTGCAVGPIDDAALVAVSVVADAAAATATAMDERASDLGH